LHFNEADDAMVFRLESAAHHEAAHIVIAAAVGLDLRPDGVLVADNADGIAVYASIPADSNESCEAVVLASEAGWWGESRFVAERHPELPEREPPHLEDYDLSWRAMGKLTPEYLNGQSHKACYLKLRDRSKHLVKQHWLAIKAVAQAVLVQEPEPIETFVALGPWTTSKGAAIRLRGDVIVEILSRHGVVAVCRPRPAAVSA